MSGGLQRNDIVASSCKSFAVSAMGRSIELVEALRPRIRMMCASYRLPFDVAEDLLQDCCLALLQNHERVRDPEAYFLGILWRKCVEWKRQRTRSDKLFLVGMDAALVEDLGPSVAENQYAKILAQQVLSRAGAQLGAWLLAYYGYDMPATELSGPLKVNTFRRRLLRCREALRQDPCFHGPAPAELEDKAGRALPGDGDRVLLSWSLAPGLQEPLSPSSPAGRLRVRPANDRKPKRPSTAGARALRSRPPPSRTGEQAGQSPRRADRTRRRRRRRSRRCAGSRRRSYRPGQARRRTDRTP